MCHNAAISHFAGEKLYWKKIKGKKKEKNEIKWNEKEEGKRGWSKWWCSRAESFLSEPEQSLFSLRHVNVFTLHWGFRNNKTISVAQYISAVTVSYWNTLPGFLSLSIVHDFGFSPHFYFKIFILCKWQVPLCMSFALHATFHLQEIMIKNKQQKKIKTQTFYTMQKPFRTVTFPCQITNSSYMNWILKKMQRPFNDILNHMAFFLIVRWMFFHSLTWTGWVW